MTAARDGELQMAGLVNLDALIPRGDFAAKDDVKGGGSPRQTISLTDLKKDGFFQNSLRKPDFQRETANWTPTKVYDLIRSFLDRDLIPAVILWERGDEIFVIDGAHRLSALIAWVRDDYGDQADSNRLFGAGITDEQRRIAKRTRDMIRSKIGTYAEFSGLVGQEVSDPEKARRLAAIGRESILIQWVTATTPKAAEDSFFKINQAAQPIDPVERTILKSRTAPNAIAARCIARGAQGHKYWGAFDHTRRERIEALGDCLYDDLYKPPHRNPTTSADVPIAGQGYNALPFVYDLVSLCNGLPMASSATAKLIPDALAPDPDGSQTVAMLEKVRKRIDLISTNDSGSLGLHPLIYFYARSGNFLPGAFLASLEFSQRLEREGRKKHFTAVRRRFEDYLFQNKIFISLAITRLGSGARSLDRVANLLWEIFLALHDGVAEDGILKTLVAKDDYVFLKVVDIPPPTADLPPSKRGASSASRSSAFIREAMANPVRCRICDAAVHSNSMTFDHDKRREDGGDNQSGNLNPAHPFCNSGFKN